MKTMTYRGHVRNGQIMLDVPASLAEGAAVTVEVLDRNGENQASRDLPRTRRFQPIEMPGGPLADDIIRDRR